MPVNAVSGYTYQTDLFGVVFGKKNSAAQKDGSPKAKSPGDDLTPDQKAEVQKLQQRDQDVRAHEQAHIAAGGAYVKGGATYQYQKGPDGKMYAVGGEVSIDTSPVKGDPRATIAKMETVKAAAMAPADPSGQDRSVAAQAEMEEAQARRDEMAEKSGDGKSDNDIQKNNGTPKSQPVSSYSSNGIASRVAKAPASKLNILA